MLPLLPIFPLAQVISVPSPTSSEISTAGQEVVVQPQEVRALPGQLDKVPVFNSNSPEVVQTDGILLSTFPPGGKTVPGAHLNMPLAGRFDVFAHHIARTSKPGDLRPLYLGVLVYNPGIRPLRVEVLQAVSYVTNPDAPFVELPPYADNSSGTVYAGPGSRLMTDVLRGVNHSDFPSEIVIPPKQSKMLFNLPVTIGNCRSTLMRLRTDERVYMASLAMRAPVNRTTKGNLANSSAYRAPKLEEWQKLLNTSNLASPRDRPPTPIHESNPDMIYGRVAGVAQGSQWRTKVADSPNGEELTIPQRGKAFSYALSTVNVYTLGTGQVQSAPMLARYPDTAYRAHGNYGVFYSLTLPLSNKTREAQTVAVKIQTPLRQQERINGLRFLEPPDRSVYFRGTVQISYKDDKGVLQTRYVHLVQRRGQQGKPLVTLKMPPGDRRLVKVDFLYPPDSVPPQVLTVRTLEKSP
jgi:hypothetical protein